jgi:hypothetical protein
VVDNLWISGGQLFWHQPTKTRMCPLERITEHANPPKHSPDRTIRVFHIFINHLSTTPPKEKSVLTKGIFDTHGDSYPPKELEPITIYNYIYINNKNRLSV